MSGLLLGCLSLASISSLLIGTAIIDKVMELESTDDDEKDVTP